MEWIESMESNRIECNGMELNGMEWIELMESNGIIME